MKDDTRVVLSTAPAEHHERQLVLGFVLVSIAVFLAAAPFAKMPLLQVPAFFPIYQSALVITDLITAVLLFTQFNISHSRALLLLACGYLFSACMGISQALSFPGLFSSTGLLDAGPQTTAWLYFLWHSGFPLFFIGYALLKHNTSERVPVGSQTLTNIRWTILLSIAAVFAFACGLTLLSTAGQHVLPVIMHGNTDARTKVIVASVTWALILAALALLWRQRPHSVLDLWLMVVMWAWVFDVALAAVLNHGRYDLGWYAGRVYGLLASSFVLVFLLLESGKLYARLAAAHAGMEEKADELLTLNKELDASIVALRDSAARIESIVNTVPDGIITIDDGGVIRSANPATERIFGSTAAELIGSNVKTLMPAFSDGEHGNYIERFRATGGGDMIRGGCEMLGRRKDGGTFSLELALNEMKLGNERCYTGIVRDVTERKKADEALVAAKIQAEQANAAKDTFLATMSHEMRTPLNGLLGMLELLGFSSLNGEQRELLEMTQDSGRGLIRIIDDVLDHAKIEAGKLELRFEAVSIQHLLRRVVNTYSAVASARNLTLEQSVDSRISASLMADPLRVLQILNNFVSNALKFTKEGYVKVRAELLARENNADTVRFSVEDSGVGIAPEVQKRLFQPFEQASAVTARLYGGTGLGLSISRRLAEMMGGTLAVKSKLGEGTTMSVTLTLPISASAPAKDTGNFALPAVALPAPEQGLTVLAVDDHSINRELLTRQLAALGVRVQAAADGETALAMWKHGGLAIVITDCNMPGMDGYTLARTIRDIEAQEGRPRTPIIAWTANVLPGAVAQCRAAGMDDALTKPADLATLRETVSRWLGAAATTLSGFLSAEPASNPIQVGPIDLSGLGKIATTTAEQAEILSDFLAQTRSDLAALHAALNSRNLPACVRIAHRMKGSSRMVGAQDLAAACDVMEQVARRSTADDAHAAQKAIDNAVERLEIHFADMVDASTERR